MCNDVSAHPIDSRPPLQATQYHFESNYLKVPTLLMCMSTEQATLSKVAEADLGGHLPAASTDLSR